MGMSMTVRRSFINILSTVIAIIVTLGAAEVVIRMTDPRTQFAVSVSTWDRVVGTRHVPNARGFVKNTEYDIDLVINSKGLRDREFSYAKPDRTRRIMCLGDSFTFGYGVEGEETYPKVMERILKADPGQDHEWEVLNAGVGSTGTAHQLAYFAAEGYKYEPDFVVVCFFQDNDFWDNIMSGLYTLENGKLVKQDAPKTPARTAQAVTRWIPGYNTLFAKSHLLNFVKSRTARYHYRHLGKRALAEHGDALIEQKEKDLTCAMLLALKEACDRIDCRLVLTAIPSSTRGWTLRESTQDVIAFARANGITYVDIREPMARSAGAGTLLAYRIDGHWTREGHEVVGCALSTFFLSEPEGF